MSDWNTGDSIIGTYAKYMTKVGTDDYWPHGAAWFSGEVGKSEFRIHFFSRKMKKSGQLLFWLQREGGGFSLRLVFPVFLHLSFGFGTRELVFFYDEGFRFVIRRT